MRTAAGLSPLTQARRRRPWATVVVAMVLALLAGGCGPPTVSVADLAADQQAYDGDEVVVSGVVVDIDEPDVRRHAVLQDARSNRVELVPFEEAQAHIGAIVEVSGRFEFDPNRGRRLHIEQIGSAGP